MAKSFWQVNECKMFNKKWLRYANAGSLTLTGAFLEKAAEV